VPELPGEVVRAMPSFTTVTEYRAAPSAVFDAIADTSTWHTFPSYGPLPGIAYAEPNETPLRLGSLVRVTNRDGSVHHERVTAFERGAHYAVELRFEAPTAWLVRRIVEDIRYEATASGARAVRSFFVEARSFLAWPLVAILAHLLLRQAVLRHDANVKSRVEGPPQT
jgi:Polyketide cyclase / dehydrase and lipid transport